MKYIILFIFLSSCITLPVNERSLRFTQLAYGTANSVCYHHEGVVSVERDINRLYLSRSIDKEYQFEIVCRDGYRTILTYDDIEKTNVKSTYKFKRKK